MSRKKKQQRAKKKSRASLASKEEGEEEQGGAGAEKSALRNAEAWSDLSGTQNDGDGDGDDDNNTTTTTLSCPFPFPSLLKLDSSGEAAEAFSSWLGHVSSAADDDITISVVPTVASLRQQLSDRLAFITGQIDCLYGRRVAQSLRLRHVAFLVAYMGHKSVPRRRQSSAFVFRFERLTSISLLSFCCCCCCCLFVRPALWTGTTAWRSRTLSPRRSSMSFFGRWSEPS